MFGGEPILSLKAERFIKANAASPVVYAGIGERECTYRLQDDSTWTFSRREAALIGHPRWAHLDHLTLEPA